MVCVPDHIPSGCPAGLHQIKTYSSNVDQDDATSQCEGWNNVSRTKFQIVVLVVIASKTLGHVY